MAFGSTTLTSAGGGDVFVAKLDSSGTVVWARGFGASSGDRGYSVAVDSSGNAFVAGQFNNSVAFGSTTLTSAGGGEVFVAKLDSSGTVVWARGFGGTGLDRGYSVAVDPPGNVHVTGWFEATAAFGATSLTSAGDVDVFVLTMTIGTVAAAPTTSQVTPPASQVVPQPSQATPQVSTTTVVVQSDNNSKTGASKSMNETLPATGGSLPMWGVLLFLVGALLQRSSRRRWVVDGSSTK